MAWLTLMLECELDLEFRKLTSTFRPRLWTLCATTLCVILTNCTLTLVFVSGLHVTPGLFSQFSPPLAWSLATSLIGQDPGFAFSFPRLIDIKDQYIFYNFKPDLKANVFSTSNVTFPWGQDPACGIQVFDIWFFPSGAFIISSLILLDLISPPAYDSDSNDRCTEIFT